jgi:ZIP family zinc transporter
LGQHGARHRKRSGDQQPSEAEDNGSGLAIAVGALLDGILESIVIGVSLVGGGAVSLVMVVAVFLSNIPKGLSSTVGMRRTDRSAGYVFGVWVGIALVLGVAALLGYTVLGQFGPAVIAAITAIAAGAILAMLVDTMVPESFQQTQGWTGLITVIGFLAAFALEQVG